jgi:hypothetical protein
LPTFIRQLAAAVLVSLWSLACATPRCSRADLGTDRHLKRFDWARPPGAEDFALASQVPPDILLVVQSYLEKWIASHEPWEKERQYPFRPAAARWEGKFLLLYVPLGVADSHFLVYSREQRCIVGRFYWFVEQ